MNTKYNSISIMLVLFVVGFDVQAVNQDSSSGLAQSVMSTSNFIVSQCSVASSSVVVDGKDFTHVKKMENGVTSEQFLIKGVPVEKEQYYAELHDAKVSGMDRQRAESERKEHERVVMKANIEKALLEKLVTTSIHDLHKDIQILEKPLLKPYLYFDSAGIKSEQDLLHIRTWLQQMLKNVNQSDVQSLHKIVDDVQAKHEMVRVNLKKTIEKATSECDDTQVLKELLELIES